LKGAVANAAIGLKANGENMINQMTINGVKAMITYDSDIDLFHGEFVGLNGGADFYAADAEGLRHEGAISLKVFMEACKEDEVEPF
jgi:predicted HicB family RNase H-like nuclease